MRRVSSENGAVALHVIVAIVVLIAINTFVVDYGVMWVGRSQSQNAADAGALAGAIALAYDNFTDRTSTGPAKTFARAAARRNGIWGDAGSIDIDTDITFPVVPADQCADTTCIRVDVYRTTQRGNPLPMLFGTSLGLSTQNVRAMAIARAAAGNASDCLKPWAIPDKWTDNHDVSGVIDTTWTADDQFEITVPNGNNKGAPLPDADVYTAPASDGTSNGTGFSLATDNGLQVTLKYGSPNDSPAPGVFLPIDLPTADGDPEVGGANYRANIAGCNGVPVGGGDQLSIENGNMVGPTSQGVAALIAQDPNARWDSTTKKVVNSCAYASPSCGPRSPRIVAVPVYDTLAFELGKQQGNTNIKVVRILGFFLDRMSGNDVVGYFTSIPGLLVNGPSLNFNAAFSKTVLLVR